MAKLLTVLIPCLNEAETLGGVVREARVGLDALKARLGIQGEILVSDNGSTDGSQKIAESLGARVVQAPVRGYGAALHSGFLAARGEWVIFGDADQSYDFSKLEAFGERLQRNEADLVLGTRLGGRIQPGAMPLLNRHLGTPALNLAIRLFFSLKTTDCNSGMRLVRRSFYTSLPMRATGMEWASELLIKSSLKQMRYEEVPIEYRKDARSRAPHLRRWRDGWRHLKTIAFLSPNRLILFPSLLIFLGGIAGFATGADDLGLILLPLGASGAALGTLLKLVLHEDQTLHSRVIDWLVKRPVPEGLLALSGLLLGAGAALYFGTELQRVGLGCFVLGALGLPMSAAWGALLTHRLNALTLGQTGTQEPERTQRAA